MTEDVELLAREYTDGLIHRYRADQLGDPRLEYVSPVAHPARHLREQVANAYHAGGKWCPACARVAVLVEKGIDHG